MAKDDAVVAEVTTKLTMDERAWLEKLKQLKKYDDDLVGWWTADERISNHDIVAIVQMSRAVLFSDVVRESAAKDKEAIAFSRKLAVVGYDRSTGASQEYINLMKTSGDLSNVEVSERLRKRVSVPLEIILLEYNDKKFVDHEPPAVYMLHVLWENLFTNYVSDGIVDADKPHTNLNVSVDRVLEDLQKYYGFGGGENRSPQIPKRKWVKKALDTLVSLGLATSNGAEYTVHYKRFRGDTLKKLGTLLHQNRSKLALQDSSQDGQQMLFEPR